LAHCPHSSAAANTRLFALKLQHGCAPVSHASESTATDRPGGSSACFSIGGRLLYVYISELAETFFGIIDATVFDQSDSYEFSNLSGAIA
jgi:hypothetical protein